ncbi:MAG: outer membrane protein transport protein, partial [Deltaproteobacteria bacterium]|nr:outer membrane protein transport protein [Deltaproteobacteria bacterium]
MRFSLVLVAALASPAAAGGLTLPVQGVRSLERAGAFVAGADDADALWLDPAGLAHAVGQGHQLLLFDVAYVYQPVTYTAAPGNAQGNQQPGSPAPQLAAAYGVSDRLVIGAGLATPYVTLARYDAAGPARYASTSTAGSTFVRLAIGAAYAVSPSLRVGATLQDHVTFLKHELVASACPPQMTCDRSYDLPMAIDETDYLSPSGSLGVQLDASPAFTIGALVQAPVRVSAAGKVTVTPPPAIANAMVTGNGVRESFWLPPVVRAGVEWHTPALRVEAALDVELWSLHDAIDIEPDHVSLGATPLRAVTIPRNFRTSLSPALGVEWHTGPMQIGGGVAYETSAVAPSYVSVLTVDAPKLLVTAGGGYAADGWQIAAAIGYARLSEVEVADPKVPVLEPLGGTASPINGGTYRAYDLVAGLRLA